MTRETKVGMVVAGSFVCLVGVVFTLKMQEGDASSAVQTNEVPAWTEPTPVVPEPTQPATAGTTSPRDLSPVGSIPPLTQPPDSNIRRTSGEGQVPPAPPPQPPREERSTPPPMLQDTPATADNHELMGPPAPPPGLAEETPAADHPHGRNHAAAEATPPPTGDVPATAGAEHTQTPTDALAAAGAGAAGAGQLSQDGTRLTIPPPDSAPPPAPEAAPAPPVGLGRPEPHPGSPPAGVMPSARPPITPIAADDLPPGVGSGGNPPPPSLMPPTPPPAASGPTRVAVTPPVPLGAPPTRFTPPIAAPPPPGQPLVEKFDEEMHRCKGGESFADLSQQYYHTPKYEKALLMFNRDHMLAADSLRSDTPQVQPNQALYVPPAWVLERRYPSLFPAQAPVAMPGSPAPIAPVGGITSNASPPAAVLERQYQVVTQTGEMMYRIAEQQLGNGTRWSDIARLNPSFNPAQPIPAGTVLRLPGQ
jgi:hypothetical protein